MDPATLSYYQADNFWNGKIHVLEYDIGNSYEWIQSYGSHFM